MQMHEADFKDAAPVEGYGPGFFRIGGEIHQGALLAAGANFGDWGGLGDGAALLALAGQIDSRPAFPSAQSCACVHRQCCWLVRQSNR